MYFRSDPIEADDARSGYGAQSSVSLMCECCVCWIILIKAIYITKFRLEFTGHEEPFPVAIPEDVATQGLKLGPYERWVGKCNLYKVVTLLQAPK